MIIDNVSVTELLAFLRSHQVAVLATVNNTNDSPHATTIYYYVEDDLKFYFLTRNQSAKMNNIKKNQSVALAITDPASLQTVQVEGLAMEVDYSQKYASTIKKFTDQLAKNDKEWSDLPLNHQGNSGYFAFVQVTPSWIRWSDYKSWEHAIKFEKNFT